MTGDTEDGRGECGPITRSLAARIETELRRVAKYVGCDYVEVESDLGAANQLGECSNAITLGLTDREGRVYRVSIDEPEEP